MPVFDQLPDGTLVKRGAGERPLRELVLLALIPALIKPGATGAAQYALELRDFTDEIMTEYEKPVGVWEQERQQRRAATRAYLDIWMKGRNAETDKKS